YILPVILLILIIGGIAWVTQYHSRWWATPRILSGKTDMALSFERAPEGRAIAMWDKEPQNNFKEFEQEAPGHYDFRFRNSFDQAIEVGLKKTRCDCASV